jgi:hypothetical protein
MEGILLAIVSLSNIACFVIGAKVGQKVAKNEPVELPKIDPLQAVREHRAQKEAEREQRREDTILRNVDRYDGTPNGQEDVR